MAGEILVGDEDIIGACAGDDWVKRRMEGRLVLLDVVGKGVTPVSGERT